MPPRVEDPGGDNNPNPNPGGGQGDKTFTQTDVDRIVAQRLEQDRKRRSKDGMSDVERDTLLTENEGLKRQIEALTGERDAAKTSLSEAEKQQKVMRRQVQAERISRAIGAAAIQANALDPNAVHKLLGDDRVRHREITVDGKPNGQYVVEVQVDVERDGVKTKEWQDATAGVAAFLTREAPYLVKSQAPAGAGSSNADTTTPNSTAGTTPDAVKSGQAVHSGMKDVGHLPAGAAATQGSNADLFQKAGQAMRERLRQG